MSETRLQDEYNKAIRECDIFLSLFSTKTGKFTEEEFDTAHQCFKKTGKPLIYTFFKDTTIRTSDICEDDLLSLFRFKQRLKDLGHFYTSFANTDDLKLRFRHQLDKLLDGPPGQ
jgi:internalin A